MLIDPSIPQPRSITSIEIETPPAETAGGPTPAPAAETTPAAPRTYSEDDMKRVAAKARRDGEARTLAKLPGLIEASIEKALKAKGEAAAPPAAAPTTTPAAPAPGPSDDLAKQLASLQRQMKARDEAEAKAKIEAQRTATESATASEVAKTLGVPPAVANLIARDLTGRSVVSIDGQFKTKDEYGEDVVLSLAEGIALWAKTPDAAAYRPATPTGPGAPNGGRAVPGPAKVGVEKGSLGAALGADLARMRS